MACACAVDARVHTTSDNSKILKRDRQAERRVPHYIIIYTKIPKNKKKGERKNFCFFTMGDDKNILSAGVRGLCPSTTQHGRRERDEKRGDRRGWLLLTHAFLRKIMK